MEQQAIHPSLSSSTKRRRRRIHSWVAWAFLCLVMGCALLGLVWRTQNNSVLFAPDTGAAYLADILSSILVPLAVLSFAIVGIALALRRETSRIGWLCLAFALTTAVQDVCWQYAYRTSVVAKGSLPAGQAVALVAVALNEVNAFLPYILILMLFPTGRFLGARWRLTATLAALCTLGLILFNVFAIPSLPATPVANPIAIKALEGVGDIVNRVAFWVFTLLLLAALSNVVIRWRQVAPERRGRWTWLIWLAGIVTGIWLIRTLVAPLLPSPYLWLVLDTLVSTGLSLALPIALGIALLGYRLYEEVPR